MPVGLTSVLSQNVLFNRQYVGYMPIGIVRPVLPLGVAPEPLAESWSRLETQSLGTFDWIWSQSAGNANEQ